MASVKRKTVWRSNFRKTFGFKPDKWERERFLRACEVVDGHWLWKGAPRHRVMDTYCNPFRLAHALLKGPVPKKAKVMAMCGKVCCNPDHLNCFTETSGERDDQANAR